MNIQDIRAKYPQYQDMSDAQLADAMHAKFYPDMPRDQFNEKIGFSVAHQASNNPYERQAKSEGFVDNTLAALGGTAEGVRLGFKSLFAPGPAKPSVEKEVDDWKKSMEGLWSTPGGKIGTVVGAIAPAIPLAAIPGANTVAGAALIGGGLGAIQPVGTGDSRAANIALGFGTGAAGQKAGNMIASGFSQQAERQAASLAASQAANASRDALKESARKAGYVIPPAQADRNLLTATAEGLAGKLSTQQLASVKNQAITRAGVAADLGLPVDTTITQEVLQNVRNNAGKAYSALDNIGPITPDKTYAEKLLQIGKDYDKRTAGIDSLRIPDVEKFVRDLQQPQFNGETITSLVSTLREEGFANKAAQSASTKYLGRTQVKLADELENLVERRLADTGQSQLLQNYRDARKLIAQTYTAQKGLNAATGDFDVRPWVRALERNKPLSGNMKLAAQMGAAYPKSMAEITTSTPGVTPLDFTAGLISQSGGAGFASAGVPFVRMLSREGLLSKPVQDAVMAPRSYQQDVFAKYLREHPEQITRLGGLLGGLLAPAAGRLPQ